MTTEEMRNVEELDELEVEDLCEGEHEIYVEENSTGKQIAIGAAGTVVGVLVLNGVKKGVCWVRDGLLKLGEARQLRQLRKKEEEELIEEGKTDE